MKLKTLIIASAITFSTSLVGFEVNDKEIAIVTIPVEKTTEAEAALIRYLKAGDESNLELLKETTHDQFRIIFRDLDKKETSEITKATYLDLIEKKIFGGKVRKVEILRSEVVKGTTASFTVKTTSGGVSFISLFSLINQDGKWLIVQDLVFQSK